MSPDKPSPQLTFYPSSTNFISSSSLRLTINRIAILNDNMASLMPFTRRPAELTSVISRACAAAQTLPSATANRRQLTTSSSTQPCAVRGQAPLKSRTKTTPTQCLYASRLPKTIIRRNSEQSATPAFKQWVFSDVCLFLSLSFSYPREICPTSGKEKKTIG